MHTHTHKHTQTQKFPPQQDQQQTMRLYLAVAVLLLALIAYADAQEETFEEKVSRYGEQVAQAFRNMADSTKESFNNLRNSQMANDVKKWFKETFGSK